MPSRRINYIFIIPDGLRISGLYTWGLNFRKITASCKLLFLNQDSPLPSDLAEGKDSRRLHSFDSHDVGKVAIALENFVKDLSPNPVIILPSVGNTSYAASYKLLQRWEYRQNVQPVRVIGSIFGDQDNPFDVLEHYESSLSSLCGNSVRIVSRLKERFPHRTKDLFLWNAFVPAMPPAPSRKPDAPIRLLFAGRLDESAKKVSRLPKICRQLANLNTPFEMSIAGEGPEEENLRQSISQLPATTRSSIYFLGALDPESLRKAFQTHQVFLLVSSTEGLPMAMLEAMAARLCHVAMEIPSGVSEIISHNRNGMLVPQEDYSAFAQCIARLSREPNNLEAMRNEARELVVREYSAKNFECLIRKEAERTLDTSSPKCRSKNDYHEKQLRQITDCCSSLKGTLAVWGGGMFGRKLTDRLIKLRQTVSVIFDKNPQFKGASYRQIPYASPAECTLFALDSIIIGSADFSNEIKTEIESYFANIDSKPPSIFLLDGK